MKSFFIAVCLILSLCITNIVFAADWVSLAKDASVEVLIDKVSVKEVSSKDGIYSVWVQVVGKVETNKLLMLINMDKGIAAVKDGVKIDNKTGKQKAVKHTKLEWNNIEPNQINGIVHSYLTENGYR